MYTELDPTDIPHIVDCHSLQLNSCRIKHCVSPKSELEKFDISQQVGAAVQALSFPLEMLAQLNVCRSIFVQSLKLFWFGANLGKAQCGVFPQISIHWR